VELPPRINCSLNGREKRDRTYSVVSIKKTGREEHKKKKWWGFLPGMQTQLAGVIGREGRDAVSLTPHSIRFNGALYNNNIYYDQRTRVRRGSRGGTKELLCPPMAVTA